MAYAFLPFYFFTFLPFKKESHQHEVGGHTDAECGYHRPLLLQPHAHEEVEDEGLQRVVHDVGEGEPRPSLGVRLHLEGVAGAGDEVEDEADDVGCGVGSGSQGMVAQRGDELHKQWHYGEIGAVLQHHSNTAHDTEPHEFAQLLSLACVHIIDSFHRCRKRLSRKVRK